jgi:hypothetical protein
VIPLVIPILDSYFFASSLTFVLTEGRQTNARLFNALRALKKVIKGILFSVFSVLCFPDRNQAALAAPGEGLCFMGAGYEKYDMSRGGAAIRQQRGDRNFESSASSFKIIQGQNIDHELDV